MNNTNPGTLILTNPEGETSIYRVKQFHFHAPSEHRIGGKQYDAELHIVHESFDEEEGGLAVIAILFDASKDIESGLVEKLNLTNLSVPVNRTLTNMTIANLTSGKVL